MKTKAKDIDWDYTLCPVSFIFRHKRWLSGLILVSLGIPFQKIKRKTKSQTHLASIMEILALGLFIISERADPFSNQFQLLKYTNFYLYPYSPDKKDSIYRPVTLKYGGDRFHFHSRTPVHHSSGKAM